MTTPRENRMNTWFHHVYLQRLFDRMLYDNVKSNDVMQHPLRYAKCEDGAPVDMTDPVIDQFLKAIGSLTNSKTATFGDIKIDLRQWLIKRDKGPVTYDLPLLDAVFATGAEEGGWRNLDAILKHMCGSTLSEVVASTQVMHDPEDPGLHGDVCYGLDLEVASFEFTNMSAFSYRRAMASSLDRLLPLVMRDVGELMARAKKHQSAVESEGASYEQKIERAHPSVVHITKNGVQLLSVDMLWPAGDTPEASIDWGKASFKASDRYIIESLRQIAPSSAISKLKGRFLEDGLGL
jgi:hypothetical protein